MMRWNEWQFQVDQTVAGVLHVAAPETCRNVRLRECAQKLARNIPTWNHPPISSLAYQSH